MQLLMWMVNAQWELFCGDIIPQHQIQFKPVSVLSGDRRDRVMWFSVSFCVNKCILVSITSPRLQNSVSQFNQTIWVFCPQAKHRHRPIHDPGLHILKALHGKVLFDPGLCHGEGIMSALEMVMA